MYNRTIENYIAITIIRARAPSTRVNRLALVSSPAHLSGPCIIHRQEQLIFNGPHFNKRPREKLFFFLSPPRHATVIRLISIALFGRERVRFRVPTFFQASSGTHYWPETRRTRKRSDDTCVECTTRRYWTGKRKTKDVLQLRPYRIGKNETCFAGLKVSVNKLYLQAVENDGKESC